MTENKQNKKPRYQVTDTVCLTGTATVKAVRQNLHTGVFEYTLELTNKDTSDIIQFVPEPLVYPVPLPTTRSTARDAVKLNDGYYCPKCRRKLDSAKDHTGQPYAYCPRCTDWVFDIETGHYQSRLT